MVSLTSSAQITALLAVKYETLEELKISLHLEENFVYIRYPVYAAGIIRKWLVTALKSEAFWTESACAANKQYRHNVLCTVILTNGHF